MIDEGPTAARVTERRQQELDANNPDIEVPIVGGDIVDKRVNHSLVVLCRVHAGHKEETK